MNIKLVTFAIIAGFVVSGASLFVGWHNAVNYLVSLMYTPNTAWIAMPIGVGASALPGIVAAGLMMAIGVRRGHQREVSETRCRKCEYILRGLREPICPECGERI